MEQEKRLLDIIKGHRRVTRDKSVRLGEAVTEVMQNQVLHRYAKFKPVMEIWDELLPEGFCGHTKLVDIARGQLKVKVDSPSYLYELRLCSSELLRELQQRCPQARIKKIQFVIG